MSDLDKDSKAVPEPSGLPAGQAIVSDDHQRWRRKLWLVLAAALVVITIAGIAVWWQSGPDESAQQPKSSQNETPVNTDALEKDLQDDTDQFSKELEDISDAEYEPSRLSDEALYE